MIGKTSFIHVRDTRMDVYPGNGFLYIRGRALTHVAATRGVRTVPKPHHQQKQSLTQAHLYIN
jgi:hypothetical protein